MSSTTTDSPREARRSGLTAALTDVWRATKEAAATYRALAEMETNSQRAHLLFGLAEAEETYALGWQTRLRELGAAELEYRGRQSGTAKSWANRVSGLDGAYQRTELVRQRRLRARARQIRESGDSASLAILAEVMCGEEAEERVLLNRRSFSSRSSALLLLTSDRSRRDANSVNRAGNANKRTGDAIDGVHSGLTVAFGIVGIVAGATTHNPNSSHIAGLAGLAGMIALALWTGASAYLAARSEVEDVAAETRNAHETLESSPDEAQRMLSLRYQSKGVPAEDADRLAEQLAAAPDDFLCAVMADHPNPTEESLANPWAAALTGTVSTAAGAIVPIAPFFFLQGRPAILATVVVSLVACFVVGAVKSVITVRRWWTSGLEIVVVGVIESVMACGIGILMHNL